MGKLPHNLRIFRNPEYRRNRFARASQKSRLHPAGSVVEKLANHAANWPLWKEVPRFLTFLTNLLRID
jgi:hypothetical protein